MARPRVLFLRSDVKLAGPGLLMLSSALALRDAGVEVTFATGGGELAGRIEQDGFNHLVVPELRLENRSAVSTAKAALKLAGLCLKRRFDAVHAFNAHAALAAFAGASLSGARVFDTVLGNGKEGLLRWMHFHLIAVSGSVKNALTNFGIPEKKIRIIYNATLDDRFLIHDEAELRQLALYRASLRPITFVSVAMFTGQKGHRQIVDAAERYNQAGYPEKIRIKFIGAGPEMEAIQALVRGKALNAQFEFAGSSSEVHKHLNDAHAFIHLAEMETFGIALAEAGARGLPCIASNVGGIPEVVIDGITGFLVDRDAAADVAQRMADLASSEALRLKFGAAGATRCKAMFARESMARDLIELYGFSSRLGENNEG